MSDFEALLGQLPSLQKLLHTHGDMSLFEYASEMYHGVEDPSPLLESRKQEFLNFIGGYVGHKFDASVSEIVVAGLRQNYAVSTAEHHGPMGHPFFFQSALLRAITRPDQPVINFATSHVSLGNSSYPRGLVFHSDIIQNTKYKIQNEGTGPVIPANPAKGGGEVESRGKQAKGTSGVNDLDPGSCTSSTADSLARDDGGVSIGLDNQPNQQNEINASYLHLPFFGSKLRMCPVFRLPAYTREDIEIHCLGRLRSYLREGMISEEIYHKITSFIQDHVLDPKILAYSTYSEQITALNQRWWKTIFPELPAYIPLDAEDIIIALLQKHLQDDTIIGRMMTDQTLQASIQEQFDGISCCFHRDKEQGTYLFWYLDDENKRHALWRKGDSLSTEDGVISIRMSGEELLANLAAHKLIPSGLFVYTIFACYYGITCFGGFAQGSYLPKIQQAYKRLLQISKNASDEQFSTQGTILNEDTVFVFEGSEEISTALDVCMHGRDMPEIIAASKNMSLNSSVKKMRPEIVRCL